MSWRGETPDCWASSKLIVHLAVLSQCSNQAVRRYVAAPSYCSAVVLRRRRIAAQSYGGVFVVSAGIRGVDEASEMSRTFFYFRSPT